MGTSLNYYKVEIGKLSRKGNWLFKPIEIYCYTEEPRMELEKYYSDKYNGLDIIVKEVRFDEVVIKKEEDNLNGKENQILNKVYLTDEISYQFEDEEFSKIWDLFHEKKREVEKVIISKLLDEYRFLSSINLKSLSKYSTGNKFKIIFQGYYKFGVNKLLTKNER